MNHLIVVGVDGSAGGRRALDWAVREAAGRGGAVLAVLAWSWSTTSPEQERARATRTLGQEVTAWAARHGSRLPVAAEVVEGRAAEVLTEAARTADLLVLGSHGHGRVRHSVLGSVSEECVRTAACPVVVIPAAAEQLDAVGAAVPPGRSPRPGVLRPRLAMEQRTRPVPTMIRPSRGVW